MLKEYTLELDGQLEVTYTISPGCKGDGPGSYYGPTPDEPPEVEDLYVGVIIKGTAIDITALLDKRQLSYIETQCMENAISEEEEG